MRLKFGVKRLLTEKGKVKITFINYLVITHTHTHTHAFETYVDKLVILPPAQYFESDRDDWIFLATQQQKLNWYTKIKIVFCCFGGGKSKTKLI